MLSRRALSTGIDLRLAHNSGAIVQGTYNNIPLGPPSARRKLYIPMVWANASATRTLDVFTIGGQTPTKIIEFAAGAQVINAQIWAIDAGAGSALDGLDNATVVFTFSGTGNDLCYAILQSEKYSLTAHDAQAASTTNLVITQPRSGFTLTAHGHTSNVVRSPKDVRQIENVALTTKRGALGIGQAHGGITCNYRWSDGATVSGAGASFGLA